MTDHSAETAPWADPPPTPALDAWHESHRHQTRDWARTLVWWPQEAPQAVLQTISGGCREPDVLPSGPLMVNLRLAGGVDIGGRLEDIEAYIDAARDALRYARWQAEQLAAEAALSGRSAAATDG